MHRRRSAWCVDDRLTADEAYGLAAQGTALLWRGDFHNARQMLTALASRTARRLGRVKRKPGTKSPAPVSFNQHRQVQGQRARTLGALLVPLAADFSIPLRRAPDVRSACTEVFGAAQAESVISLRALLGIIGAHQWRTKGIDIPAAGGRIHPHYGVFAPIRSEYVDLVAGEPLPTALGAGGMAFDIGTGTGVLAAVLARRGVAHVVATDMDARSLACARENIERLGLQSAVQVTEADLFPPGRAALIVCNPPWIPARPSSPIERGIFDEGSQMLLGFVAGLREHLAPGGEGWLLLSDLAEHLGLRSRGQLLEALTQAGLTCLGRSEARPVHGRTRDAEDPFHAARAAEVTSLWRLAATD